MKQTLKTYTHRKRNNNMAFVVLSPFFIFDFSSRYPRNISFTGCIFNNNKNLKNYANISLSFKCKYNFGKKEKSHTTSPATV